MFPLFLLTLKSVWLLISPYSIILESIIKVMRKKGNDLQFKKLQIVKQILLVMTKENIERTEWRM